MMWFSSVLLFLAFTSAFADDTFAEDVNACVSHIVEELESLESLKAEEQLKGICPLILNAFDCMDGELKTLAGMTFEDLAEATETEIGRVAELALNVRGIFVDLCTEGSPLNEVYMADADCFDSMEVPVGMCKENEDAAMEELFGFAENAMEVEDDEQYTPDADCAQAAYISACVAAAIHDECGLRAFDTFNSIVKRSGVFKKLLCSAEDLQYIKTTFVDKLDLDDDQKDLLRLAFDLKKRRK